MKIPTTPEIRRFNRAVEQADYLLRGYGDRLPVDLLVLALGDLIPLGANYGRAALELEAAAAEVNGKDQQ